MNYVTIYIQKILAEAKARKSQRYDDPVTRASLHGYIEAMEEILELIEDNE